MSRKDLIIDFETMGNNLENHDVAIIDCSAFIFDWERFKINPYSFEEIVKKSTRYKLSVKDQVENYSFVVEDGAVKFWSKQSKEVRKRIAPKQTDLTLDEFFSNFSQKFLLDGPKIEYWWSRSNTFDPHIIWRISNIFKKREMLNEYLKFWRIRDVRTYIDAKFDFGTMNNFVPINDEDYWNKSFQMHNSKHDIAADVLRLQAIHRAENELEQVNR